MSESFDAYYNWLGIPPAEQPPNHYRLLGLQLFETNDDVIDNAADRQMSHVRLYQTGKHSDRSQELLNTIAAARYCLLNPAQKSEYDARLKAERESKSIELQETTLPEEKPLGGAPMVPSDLPLSSQPPAITQFGSDAPIAPPKQFSDPVQKPRSSGNAPARPPMRPARDSSPDISAKNSPIPNAPLGQQPQPRSKDQAATGENSPPVLPPQAVAPTKGVNPFAEIPQVAAPIDPAKPVQSLVQSPFPPASPFGRPNRGGTVFTLGLLGLIFSIPACCPYLFILLPISLALCIPAWVMGKSDLTAMQYGSMDANDNSMTHTGYILAIIGTVLCAISIAGLIGLAIYIYALVEKF